MSWFFSCTLAPVCVCLCVADLDLHRCEEAKKPQAYYYSAAVYKIQCRWAHKENDDKDGRLTFNTSFLQPSKIASLPKFHILSALNMHEFYDALCVCTIFTFFLLFSSYRRPLAFVTPSISACFVLAQTDQTKNKQIDPPQPGL